MTQAACQPITTRRARRKAVVVTGAANGIGRAIAARLAATGWAVVGIDRDVAALEEVAGSVGGVAVPGDIRDQEVITNARQAAEGAGRLSAWVNNAGVVRLGPLHLMPADVIDETLDIDLRAVVFGAREALRSFLANGVSGSIVNISSVHARGSFPGYGPYDAAKGGIESLTRYVCVEYGHLGIRCNAIAPGAVNTNIVPAVGPDEPGAVPVGPFRPPTCHPCTASVSPRRSPKWLPSWSKGLQLPSTVTPSPSTTGCRRGTMPPGPTARSRFRPRRPYSADPGGAPPGSFLPRIGCRPPGRQPPDGSSLTRLLRVRGRT